MKQFIEFKTEVLIPIQIVEVAFYEKEENSLNPFQYFILEAVELEKGIDQIAEATSLTRNVIEKEIVQMIGQKLLIKESESISLSELSKKLLMISRCVKELNKEKKHLFINLMTCEIENLENEELFNCEDDYYLHMNPKISEKDIDGISVENNISFFADYMNSFVGMNKTDIETVLSSVFAKFKTLDKTKYIKKTINRLPCLIGGNTFSSHNQNINPIVAKGIFYELKYQVESQVVSSNLSILPELTKINAKDNKLLSDKGLNILQLNERLNNYNNLTLNCFYDVASGQFQFEKAEETNVKGVRPHLFIPLLNDISVSTKEMIIKQLREYYSITDEFDVKELSCNKVSYQIECDLFDLWRNDNE